MNFCSDYRLALLQAFGSLKSQRAPLSLSREDESRTYVLTGPYPDHNLGSYTWVIHGGDGKSCKLGR